ncbi:tRNA pseudouridine(54/55) synthase Pus10 [archaeon]|nr:MAG: tRNA pseudouridine(54/55) synthase Pus10 [archaeon]
MKFPLEIFEDQKNKDKLEELLKEGLCDNCLGRQFGMLGHGMTNKERGEILREFAGKKESETCKLCGNFFKGQIDKVANDISKKLGGMEYETFLIGSIPSDEVARKQDELWEKFGIDNVEPIKAEINREVGKRVEKLAGKSFSLKNPDVTAVIDMKKNELRLMVRSLFVGGGYKKLVRGIPQSKWVCLKCGGKGCVNCEGMGQLYPTSVQEIAEKPLLKATGAKKSKFSAAGREDIDARCLDWRPFVLELIRPLKRKIDLKKLEKQVNKSKKVQVKGLKVVADKGVVRNLKATKADKTYLAEVKFANKVDLKKLKEIRKFTKEPILQKTPIRVVHRRADICRKRAVRSITYQVVDDKTVMFKIRGESGLYIKELIYGDEGRTTPNVAAVIGNKVKKISLDVIKIWTK